MLAEHYGLPPGAPLPHVPFNPFHGRAHRFGPAPYLFQYSHQHLSDLAISACLRFLLHGMVFRTRDGQPVASRRTCSATPSPPTPSRSRRSPSTSSANGSSKRIWTSPTTTASPPRAWLPRRPTATSPGSPATSTSARPSAVHPFELRTLFDAARGKVGTLAEVIGGHCVSHGFCAAKFACVGCAGKVPDPAKRHQIERHRAWAQTQVDLATDEGLFPEAERMKQLIRDCDSELHEMDQIDAYRRDEAHAADIQIAPGP